MCVVCECHLVPLFCRNSPTFKSFEDKMGNLKVSRQCPIDIISNASGVFSIGKQSVMTVHNTQVCFLSVAVISPLSLLCSIRLLDPEGTVMWSAPPPTPPPPRRTRLSERIPPSPLCCHLPHDLRLYCYHLTSQSQPWPLSLHLIESPTPPHPHTHRGEGLSWFAVGWAFPPQITSSPVVLQLPSLCLSVKENVLWKCCFFFFFFLLMSKSE